MITIIAILGAVAGPRFAGSIAYQRVEAAARRVAADLELVRGYAMQTSAGQTVDFALWDDLFIWEDMAHPDHPALDYEINLLKEFGATVDAANFGGETYVIFDIYGVPSAGGSVTISVGSWAKIISVDSESGWITVN